ncbi:MAG TPA: hypothetical protein VLA37_01450, partial [Sphingomonadaceae bacterium]|nr:hypothetical protein [Sphingomonadaceae bacterium]
MDKQRAGRDTAEKPLPFPATGILKESHVMDLRRCGGLAERLRNPGNPGFRDAAELGADLAALDALLASRA